MAGGWLFCQIIFEHNENLFVYIYITVFVLVLNGKPILSNGCIIVSYYGSRKCHNFYGKFPCVLTGEKHNNYYLYVL